MSGSTAVVTLVVGDVAYVANAGDSRAVLSKKGVGTAITTDHKPEDEAEYARRHLLTVDPADSAALRRQLAYTDPHTRRGWVMPIAPTPVRYARIKAAGGEVDFGGVVAPGGGNFLKCARSIGDAQVRSLHELCFVLPFGLVRAPVRWSIKLPL